MEGTELFKTQIKAYIDRECLNDDLFKKIVDESDITIDHVCNHIFSEVQKANRCGWSDEEIFKMVRDCYNDNIKNENEPSGITKVVSNCHIELTEEEKNQEKAKALEEYKESERKKLEEQAKKEAEAKAKAEEKAKAKEEAKKQRAIEDEKKAKGDQMSLDDLFGDL